MTPCNLDHQLGTTRHAVMLFRIAVKVPRVCSWHTFLCGLLSNVRERRLWKDHRDKPSGAMLAEVLYADPIGFVLIMRRATTVYKARNTYLSAFFAACRFEDLPCDDIPQNVGVFDGYRKLIDYGD